MARLRRPVGVGLRSGVHSDRDYVTRAHAPDVCKVKRGRMDLFYALFSLDQPAFPVTHGGSNSSQSHDLIGEFMASNEVAQPPRIAGAPRCPQRGDTWLSPRCVQSDVGVALRVKMVASD